MIVHSIPTGMVQVSVVKIVGMVIVLHSDVATVRAMLVTMSTGLRMVSLRHVVVLSSMRTSSAGRTRKRQR
jgi:hypothetical protein